MAQAGNDEDKGWELAKDIGFCMLTTQSGNELRARRCRRMPIARRPPFYFLTDIAGTYSLESRRKEAKGFYSFRDRYQARTDSRGDDDLSVMLSERYNFATDKSFEPIAVTTCLLHIVRRH